MQSGINASQELRDAFAAFDGDQSLFCLPVTITGEHLTPLDAIAFAPSDGSDAFYSSLPSLKSLLQPKTPLYLLLRRSTDPKDGLTFLTYIPYNSPVRSKTLFASTRTTLREIGGGKLSSQHLAAEEAEVYSEDIWHERFHEKGLDHDQESTTEERDLDTFKHAEEAKALSMDKRDIGIGGSIGQDASGERKPLFSIGEGVEDAMKTLNEEGSLVKLAMDVPTESLALTSSHSDVAPGDIASHIPIDKAQYTFYRYPNSTALLMIYTCPSGIALKERMINACSRAGVALLARNEGLEITHTMEGAEPDDLSIKAIEERINPPKQESAPKRGFAKPRRPGR